jgi:hypothetical protein
MHRIDNTTAATSLPPSKPAGQPGFFTVGSVGGTPATIVEADWLNTVQEELLAIVAEAGRTPNKAANNQVILSILDLLRNNTRQRLTGALDLYVATTGSDTNDGLTVSTPFATLQAAWNFIMARLDCGNNYITVHIADGTYSRVECTGMPMGGGRVIFLGNTVNPTNCIIQSSTLNFAAFHCLDTLVYVEGVSLHSTGNAFSHGILAYNATVILSGRMDYGACTGGHLYAANGGTIIIDDSYTISGGAPLHMAAVNNATVAQLAVPTPGTITVTLSGSPTFSQAFAFVDSNGVVHLNPSNFHFAGGASGKRYSGISGGQFNVSGGGSNYFPGTIAGTVDAGTYSAYAG